MNVSALVESLSERAAAAYVKTTPDHAGVEVGATACSDYTTTVAPPPNESKSAAERAAKVAEILGSTIEIPSRSSADLYLKSRGINIEVPSNVIRCRPRHGSKFGALVAVCTDDNGNPQAVHQVYLHPKTGARPHPKATGTDNG